MPRCCATLASFECNYASGEHIISLITYTHRRSGKFPQSDRRFERVSFGEPHGQVCREKKSPPRFHARRECLNRPIPDVRIAGRAPKSRAKPRETTGPAIEMLMGRIRRGERSRTVGMNHRPPACPERSRSGPEPDTNTCCSVLPGIVSKCLVLFRLPSTCCLGLFRAVSGCSDSYKIIYSGGD
jgi:hypothetical protein